MPHKRFTLVPAVHLLLVRDGSILLSRRFNTGYRDGWYSVIAGHVEGGEPLTTAMMREAHEEAGISIVENGLSFAHVMHRRSSDREQIDVFFTARGWKGDAVNLEPDRCDDLSWFPVEALPKNTVPYIRNAIACFRSSIPFSEFGWIVSDEE